MRRTRASRRARTHGRWWLVQAIVSLAILCGCSADSPSVLDPAGTGARRVAGLWWFLLSIALVVCVVVIALLLTALWRRRGSDIEPTPGGRRLVVIAGVVVPAIVLTTVYGVGLREMRKLELPTTSTMTVDVIGHQWWWEVRYGGSQAVTANEIHIPLGEVVHLRLQTSDVLHSFWVPQLMPKTDLIAGRINDTWLRAERVGTFRGQCAEYCGLQHGHMAFTVVVQSPPDFQEWVARQARPAPGVSAAGTQPLIARGQRVIETASCASCHTVRGTSAHGVAGPDLTHFGERSTIAAATVANTPGHVAGWISNSQTIKPGNLMPPQPLSPDELRAVVAFLEAGGDHALPGEAAPSSPGPVPSASAAASPTASAERGTR